MVVKNTASQILNVNYMVPGTVSLTNFNTNNLKISIYFECYILNLEQLTFYKKLENNSNKKIRTIYQNNEILLDIFNYIIIVPNDVIQFKNVLCKFSFLCECLSLNTPEGWLRVTVEGLLRVTVEG